MNIFHWLFGSNSLFSKWFGYYKPHAPTPPPVPVPPPPVEPPAPHTGEYGKITRDGLAFKTEDGKVWSWRGMTGFLLYQRWLEKKEGIDPLIENWMTASGLSKVSPNVIRVFGMVNSFSHWWPQEHPDYFDQLRPFVDHLWNKYGLRVEFVIFADTGEIMPDVNEQNAHAERVVETLKDAPNVFIEIANEPSAHVNMPGGDARAYELCQRVRNRGLLIASGAGDGQNAGDYVTPHTPRDEEWPRKAKDVLDVRDVSGKPTVGDEPIGFAEVEKPGSRATSATDAAYYAAAAALMGAGSTFHSDCGVNTVMLEPVQAKALAAWMAAASWVPSDAQLSPYMRGGSIPGCNWVGESVCAHDDARELRSFGKIIGNEAWVVQIRTDRTAPSPCSGWVIDSAGPSVGLTKFYRG